MAKFKPHKKRSLLKDTLQKKKSQLESDKRQLPDYFL